MTMVRTLFTLFLLSVATLSLGQTVAGTVYFASGDHSISKKEAAALEQVVSTLKTLSAVRVEIQGHTDNTGSEAFNDALSLRRAEALRQHLLSAGIPSHTISVKAYGSSQPVADNMTEEGRRLNRRASVFTYVDSNNTGSEEDISILYRQLEPPPQIFNIDPNRDTILHCAQGTIIYIKAYSFRSVDCGNRSVSFKVKEVYSKSDMILHNLTTTSDSSIIESQGMLHTEAEDCKGTQLDLQKGKELVIIMPADTVLPGAQVFQGQRGHDEVMNWTVDNNAELADFTLDQMVLCGGWLCVHKREVIDCEPCAFFFCRIGRLPGALFRSLSAEGRARIREFNACQEKLRNVPDSAVVTNVGGNTVVETGPPLPPRLRPKCQALEDLFKKYGVNNVEDLVLAINKPLLDKYQVKTMIELQDTLFKVNLQKIELNYVDKKISYKDFNYYIYNSSRLGWSNIDCFSDYPKSSLITMKVNLRAERNVDCKLVFVNSRSVLSATDDEKKFVFKGVPRGEPAYIVAIKYQEGKPMLAMRLVEIGWTTYDVEFRELTLAELKEQLKVLDRGDTRD